MKKEVLAELCGIMLGDGCFYKAPRCYQITVCFDKRETEYLKKVRELFELICPGEKFSIHELKDELFLRTYSRKIANILLKNGIKTGSKTKRDILIPKWIFSEGIILKSFIRGLLDTDGCVYRKYGPYLQIQLKLANKSLVEDTRRAFVELGFNPTRVISDFEKTKQSMGWKFYLSRQGEISKFIKEVGFRNPKHQCRYRKFAAR